MNKVSPAARGLLARVRTAHTRLTWESWSLGILLTTTALLYCWGLDRNGWANSYYSAAAMSGAQNWAAFLFGSSDPANAISVDKPPASLWVMALSVRLFGLSSWSILVPQALFGVMSVYLLYRTARTYTDAPTSLIAGSLFAVTPVAAVMFRYNNPDALLCLVMVAIGYTTLRAIRTGSLLWLIVAGSLIGVGFLTKQLQVALIVPAMLTTYLVFAKQTFLRRTINLTYCAAAAVLSGGWWLLLIQLTDPSSRPFVGGSSTNSAAELTLGYNGLERITGQDISSAPAAGEWASAMTLPQGLQRFLEPGFTGQFGWFLPLAIAGTIVAAIQVSKRIGKPGERAFLVFNVLWLIVALLTVAFMSGIVHPYYGLTAVPPMCILAGWWLRTFVRSTPAWPLRSLALATLLASALMAYVSAARSSEDFPGLPLVLLLLWALAIAFGALRLPHPQLRRISSCWLALTLLLGPALWSLNTVLTGHIGASVSAGPATLGTKFDDPGRQQLGKDASPNSASLMLGDIPATGVVSRLSSANSTWPAAIVGSESAANYQLATRRPIMALGGFNGSDPFPTLEGFIKLVEERKIGALVVQNLPPVAAEGRGEAARIVAWVRSHYRAQVIDGAEYYNLIN